MKNFNSAQDEAGALVVFFILIRHLRTVVVLIVYVLIQLEINE